MSETSYYEADGSLRETVGEPWDWMQICFKPVIAFLTEQGQVPWLQVSLQWQKIKANQGQLRKTGK